MKRVAAGRIIRCLLIGASSAVPWVIWAADSSREFALVAVGDMVISRPLSMLQNRGAFNDSRPFADALALLRQSDATYGNLETVIFDIRKFQGAPYSWDGDWPLSSVPEVANDLGLMHVGLVSRANNHALDWGLEGMRECGQRVAAAGIAQAGVGEDAREAAAPAYYSSVRGKIALVSMVSTFRATTNALPVSAAAPRGRPGVNGLTLTETLLVDKPAYEQAAQLACRFAGTPCPAAPNRATIDLFGANIRVAQDGEAPFSHVYQMAPEDLERIMAGVRSAKPAARYLIASIHAHEQSTDEDPPATWDAPAAFLKTLAHQLIDNGADVFVTTGIHHVAGIEIYRGKAIFYGLGNFFWSDIQLPLSADLYDANANRAYLQRSFEHPERATDGDLTLVMNANSSGFATAGDKGLNRTFQSVLTRTVFDDVTQSVKEIRLYPMDLGYGEKLTRSGIPRRAGLTVANSVLDRIIRLSGNSGVRIRKVNDGPYLIGVATPE